MHRTTRYGLHDCRSRFPVGWIEANDLEYPGLRRLQRPDYEVEIDDAIVIKNIPHVVGVYIGNRSTCVWYVLCISIREPAFLGAVIAAIASLNLCLAMDHGSHLYDKIILGKPDIGNFSSNMSLLSG